MVDQVKLVVEHFAAELAHVTRGGVRVLEHHVPLDAVGKVGGHVAQYALVHSLARFPVEHFAVKFRESCKNTQRPCQHHQNRDFLAITSGLCEHALTW